LPPKELSFISITQKTHVSGIF